MRGDLSAHYLVVEAARHQGHAVDVSGQLEGEGLRDRDGLEHVLDAQHGALARARRRDRQQDRRFLVLSFSEQDFLWIEFHGFSFLYWSLYTLSSFRLWAPGRHSMTSVSSGVASMRTGKRLSPRQQQPVPARARQQPSLEVFGQVEGVAHGAHGGCVLLEQELEGGVLQERPTGVAGYCPRCVLTQKVLDVLGDELEAEAVLARPLCYGYEEGRALRVLHDRPHLVDDQQAGLWVLCGGGPHRLGADHRGGGPQFRLQQPQVEDGDEGLAGEEVVALVREQVPEAAGGEGPQQAGQAGIARLVFLQVFIKVAEPRALPGPGVVARQGVVEGCPSLRAQTLADHDLDEASQAADALEELLGVALVDDEGVHALARHAGGQNASARCAGHVRVLALRVDHVGGDAARQASEHPQLGGEGLP